MRNLKVIFFVLVLILGFSLVYCGSDDGSSSEDTDVFKVHGTVTLDGQPAEGLSVKFEYGEGSANAGSFVYDYVKNENTDAAGEYEFTKKVQGGGGVQAKYWVSVQRPDGSYTNQKGGTALNSKTDLQNFAITTQ